MPRPRQLRRIFFEPKVTYFKPAGVTLRELTETILTKDELEAVRLIDLENTSQEKAAKKMKISQPTLSRLLTSARKKLADAIVKGKAIKIQGGDFEMARPRANAGLGKGSGRCIRRGISRAEGRGRMGGPLAAGPGGTCICPKCSYKEPQIIGIPCMSKKCPKCKTPLTRA